MTVTPGPATDPAEFVYPQAAWAALARTAGRYPQSRFYDDLARLASSGALSAVGLLRCARDGHVPDGVRLDPRGLAWFAHVTASRIETDTQARDTAHLFALAHRVGGRRVLARQLDTVWVQALHLAGRLEEFSAVLRRSSAPPGVWWAARTDSARPQRIDAGAQEEETVRWVEMLNEPFTEAGLEPFDLAAGEGAAFDRLTWDTEQLAMRAPAPERAPLISVVVPVYNPGPSLRSTVAALLDQTWTNTEVILSDDASTSGCDLIEELATHDERIRVVRAPRNAGAYAARNLGVGVAQGDLITFNDADDVSHPRRLERQYAAITSRPHARASVSRSIRLTSTLSLTVMGRPPERLNLSSVMLARIDMLQHLGGFDTVRKGADSEFIARFSAVFGTDALVEMDEPLALVQLTTGSLSRDDYRFMRTHPARLQYQSAFRQWHKTLDGDDAYLPPGIRAPFPAPDYIAGTPRAEYEIDVLVLANLTDQAPSAPSLAAEVRALIDLGLSVGVLEYLSPFDLTDSVRQPAGTLAELIHAGAVRRVLPGEQIRSRLAIVRDPAAVRAMPVHLLHPIKADQTLVIADYCPDEDTNYAPVQTATLLTEHLQSPITWLPATEPIAAALHRSSRGAQILPAALFGCVPRVYHRARSTSPLRVGVSPGSVQRMPTDVLARRLDVLMPATGPTFTWGASQPIAAAAPRPTTHVDPAAFPLNRFADQVDIMLVDTTPGRGAHLDRVVLAALSRGCVPILDASFRDHFGPAALYRDTGTATELFTQLAHDTGLLARIRRAGAALLSSDLSTTALQHHIISIMSTHPEGEHAMRTTPEGAHR